MVIKSLTLDNYRRFRRLDIECPENIIGIIGRNGSGKSTIVEAIGWVLYGNRIARTDKLDIRSQFADAKSECKAEMIFEYGGSEFRVVRKLKGKNAAMEAAVYRDGNAEPVAVQDRGVNDFIDELLQLDYRSFTTSVFAQQKELAKLSSLRPEERRQAINRLINIDRIDRARDAIRRDRNEKTAFLAGKKSLQKDAAALKEQQDTKSAEHRDKKKAAKTSKARVKTASDTLLQSKNNLEAYSKLRDQYQTWRAQCDKLRSRQQENNDALKRTETELRSVEKAERELAELQPLLRSYESIKKQKEELDTAATLFERRQGKIKERDIIEKSLDKEQQSLKQFQQKYKNLNAQESSLARITKELQSLEASIQSVQALLNDARGTCKALEKSGKEAGHKLSKIKELGPNGECPVCTQNLSDHYESVIAELENELEKERADWKKNSALEQEHANTLKELETELRQARNEKEQLSIKVSTARDAQTHAASIESRIAEYKNQQDLVETELKDIGDIQYEKEQHNTITRQFKEASAQKEKSLQLEERIKRKSAILTEIKRINDTLADIKTDLAAAENAQAELGYSEEHYVQLKKEVEDHAGTVDMVKNELNKIERELALLEKDMEAIERNLQEQETLRKDIAVAEEEILYLNALEDHFGRFRLELAGRIRPLIAHRASELLALTTLSRYSMLELDQDYNISVYDGTAAFPVERFSGGEQDLANLCLRIAISQVVAERSGGAPINLIVLDEIFGSQDVERRDLILNALGQLQSQFRQIFIITHIEAVRDVLPVLIHVQVEDDEQSRISIV